MTNKKTTSKTLKNGIKTCLSVALKVNANSTGCFIAYQPKSPKNLYNLKKIK